MSRTPEPQPASIEFSRPLMSHRLTRVQTTPFTESATESERAALATLFDALSVDRFTFEGKLNRRDDDGLDLTGTLTATVVQSCVVTLKPVVTKIKEKVVRQFVPDLESDRIEFRTDDDDTLELMPRTLNLGLIATEAAALALPTYPRSAEAESELAVLGDAPDESDVKIKPFAGLAALRDKLSKED